MLSDLHLGDGSASDLFGQKDEAFVAMLAEQLPSTDVVVVNGDAVDHLQASAAARIERAHPRVLEALRTVAAERPMLYVLGNHEEPQLLLESLPDARFVHAVAVGEELCIAHGHQFDLNWGRGGEPWMVHLHTWLETLFQRPIRQPYRDHDNPLNAVVHRLFFFYTQALRLEGLARRALGRPERYAHWQRVDNFWARGQWGDLSCIFECAAAYLTSDTPWGTLLLGHSHAPGVVAVGDRRYANAGSWALEQSTICRVEDGAPTVRDWRSGRVIADEPYRALVSGQTLPDMAGWFRRYYRGFFRYDLEAIRRDFPG